MFWAKESNRSKRAIKRKQHIQKDIDVLTIKRIELEIEVEKLQKRISEKMKDLRLLVEREKND